MLSSQYESVSNLNIFVVETSVFQKKLFVIVNYLDFRLKVKKKLHKTVFLKTFLQTLMIFFLFTDGFDVTANCFYDKTSWVKVHVYWESITPKTLEEKFFN